MSNHNAIILRCGFNKDDFYQHEQSNETSFILWKDSKSSEEKRKLYKDSLHQVIINDAIKIYFIVTPEAEFFDYEYYEAELLYIYHKGDEGFEEAYSELPTYYPQELLEHGNIIFKVKNLKDIKEFGFKKLKFTKNKKIYDIDKFLKSSANIIGLRIE